MKTATFQSLLVGLLCLTASGLGAGLHDQHRRLTRLQANALATHVADAAQRPALQQLQGEQQALRRELQALRQAEASRPEPPDLAPRLEQLAEALQQLRHDLAERAPQHAITALAARLEQLEARLAALKPPVPAAAAPAPRRPRSKPVLNPAPLHPPFTLRGIEVRGGERFLSVAPSGSRALAELQLLQVGERLGGWQLTELGRVSARVARDGQAEQSLLLP